MRRALLLAAAVLGMAGCAGSTPPPAQPAPVQPPPAASPPPSPSPPVAAPAAATPARPANDTCGLAALGDLVGKPRMEIPVPVDVSRRRVVCEGCPVTQDLRSDRQTIWYDQGTGRVTRLQCG